MKVYTNQCMFIYHPYISRCPLSVHQHFINLFINLFKICLISWIYMTCELYLGFSLLISWTHQHFKSLQLELAEIKLIYFNDGHCFLHLLLLVIISWCTHVSLVVNIELFIGELCFDFLHWSFCVCVVDVDEVWLHVVWDGRVVRKFVETCLTGCAVECIAETGCECLHFSVIIWFDWWSLYNLSL